MLKPIFWESTQIPTSFASGCINFNNYFPNAQSDLLYILIPIFWESTQMHTSFAYMATSSGCINFNNYFPNAQSDLLYI